MTSVAISRPLPARRRMLAALALVLTGIALVPPPAAHALPIFSIGPTTLAFPTTTAGNTSASLTVTVTNVSAGPQTLASVSGGVPFDAVNFGVSQDCAGATLAAGASCGFTYTFHPMSAGTLTTTTNFTLNGETSGTISLSGVATPMFSIAPTTAAFPDTTVDDTSAPIDVLITNLSANPQTLTAVAGGAPSDSVNFGGVQNCVGVTLAPGDSCAFSYTFHPTSAGAKASSSSFSINGQDSGPITLTGTGTLAYSIAPTTLSFPDTIAGDTSAPIDVLVANVSSSPRTLTAVAGGAPFDSVNFGGVQNCVGVTLAPGDSCAFSYTFHPTSAGAKASSSSFSINGQDSGPITLTGTGTDTFSIAPTTAAFPDTAVGDTSAPIDVLITNLSANPQTLTAVAGGAPFDSVNFGGVQNCVGVTLAPGGTCTFSYTFHPTSAGAKASSTSFSINGQDSGPITLNGNGTTEFSIAPTTLTFPDTAVGDTSAGLAVTITNLATTDRTLTAVAGGAPSDAANFGAVQNCVGVTLAPGGTCTFSYTFHPTSTGPLSTTTSFSINGQASGTITLTGTGTLAYSIAPTTLNFPGTPIGDTSAPIDVLVTNLATTDRTLTAVAGGAPSDAANFGAVQNCVGVTLAPGGTCAFSYTFHPTSAGALSTTTSLSINGQSSGTITLTGTGTIFAIAPNTVTFPATAIGDTSAGIDVTVTNTSGSPQTLSSVGGGAPSDSVNFGGVQNCAGATLAPGGTCTFSYTFHPTSTGPLSTTTSFTINGQASGTITLTGTGTLAYSIAPTTLNFPDTPIGDTSAPIDVLITNLATTDRTLTAVAGGAPSDAANFGAVQNCAGATLAAGASCTFSYTFHPTSAGALSTTTSFTINGQASGTITLTGTGTPAFGAGPTTLTFPDTAVGSTSAPQTVTITNLTSNSQTLTVAGGAPIDPTHFAGSQDCAGATLAPGASCTFTYTFAPVSAGPHATTTSITLTSTAALALGSGGRAVRLVMLDSVITQQVVITMGGTGLGLTPTPTPTATPTPTTPATGGSSGLGQTGAELSAPLALGAGALGFGGLLVLVSRRRRV